MGYRSEADGTWARLSRDQKEWMFRNRDEDPIGKRIAEERYAKQAQLTLPERLEIATHAPVFRHRATDISAECDDRATDISTKRDFFPTLHGDDSFLFDP